MAPAYRDFDAVRAAVVAHAGKLHDAMEGGPVGLEFAAGAFHLFALIAAMQAANYPEALPKPLTDLSDLLVEAMQQAATSLLDLEVAAIEPPPSGRVH